MRTRVLLCVGLALAAVATSAEGQIIRRRPVPNVPARPIERTVIVPEDEVEFTVSPQDLVRLTGRAQAGSTIEAKVQGPARIVAENAVESRSKGRMPIGELVKEFEIKPNGKGKVTVTITAKFAPNPDQKPKVTTYKFEVK